MSTQDKTEGLEKNLCDIICFLSVFLDIYLFVLNASGLLYIPGWPGPHSVAKGALKLE